MPHTLAPPAPSDRQPIALVERPWGSFRQYAHNQAVTVSLMAVQPGQRLSLQSHVGRAELWIVLDDGAVVQVGEEVLRPRAGDEIWIPARTRHRLSSAGPPVRVLEVAFGNWQQDDITRYDDDYARPEQGE
jgi:mannose-1-phosphate guanylyltransferase/mannose-6-phosphate isomerase